MSLRLYLPTTLPALAGHLSGGHVPVPDDAVLAPDDTEEGEYAALMQAAEASRQLLDGPGRRVVVVTEVAGESAVPDTVALRDVLAVHVDDRDDADEDDDLGWYATQELGDLLP
ncbi:DUF6912 family protein [Nocardioides sp. GCM10027113]|uniref:DUF6912 family protein n=1 Tax=unclassified Nocardioides TaxID=2615069 RepID=UPI003609D53E